MNKGSVEPEEGKETKMATTKRYVWCDELEEWWEDLPSFDEDEDKQIALHEKIQELVRNRKPGEPRRFLSRARVLIEN